MSTIEKVFMLSTKGVQICVNTANGSLDLNTPISFLSLESCAQMVAYILYFRPAVLIV